MGHLPRCRWAPSPFLELLRSSLGEADVTSSSRGFSFGQKLARSQRVVGWTRPGPASRDGGGVQQQHVWKPIGRGAPVWWGGGLVLPPPERWFLS
uniref:Uncharacterized protein n=1 Tax=Oryza punctata TaxID=4537 RepID=A0A0E0M1Z6_ORYPU